MYFSNSQASRLLPIPACPVTETTRSAAFPGGRVEQLLEQRQLRRPADERRLELAGPPGPPRQPTTRSARQSRTGSGEALERAFARGLEDDRCLGGAPRRLVGQDRSGFRSGLEAGREIDRVAGDHALAVRADRHGHFAARHPGAAREARRTLGSRKVGDRVHQVEGGARARSASSSFEVGAPHTAITASPMNFSTVPP